MIILLGILRKIWPYLLGVTAILLIFGYVYHKGGKDATNSLINQGNQEINHRLTQDNEVVNEGQHFQHRVRRARNILPATDLDSLFTCLLSSTNPTKDCGSKLPPSP